MIFKNLKIFDRIKNSKSGAGKPSKKKFGKVGTLSQQGGTLSLHLSAQLKK